MSPGQFVKWANRNRTPEEIVRAAFTKVFGERLVLTSSFGIQSAVALHFVSKLIPKIPVIFIDTGYSPEKLEYAQQLQELLKLRLEVFRSLRSPREMELRHGKLWEYSPAGWLEERKLEPMRRALFTYRATAWISGARAEETEHRKSLKPAVLGADGFVRIYPLLHWSFEDIRAYYQEFALPDHPLVTKRWKEPIPEYPQTSPKSSAQEECGLHLDSFQGTESNGSLLA